MTIEKFLYCNEKISIGKIAMLISLTETREEEEIIKNLFLKKGFKCAATEIGGHVDENFFYKLTKSLIGAAVNNDIIESNNTKEAHAIIHAAHEAEQGFLVTLPGSVNVGIKIGIVRKDGWVAVALFGESAYHNLTSHTRACLGMMHI